MFPADNSDKNEKYSDKWILVLWGQNKNHGLRNLIKLGLKFSLGQDRQAEGTKHPQDTFLEVIWLKGPSPCH